MLLVSKWVCSPPATVGMGIAQQSQHSKGDLELLKAAKMLKQTWQMELSVQRCNTVQAWPAWVPAGLLAWAGLALQALAGIVGCRR